MNFDFQRYVKATRNVKIAFLSVQIVTIAGYFICVALDLQTEVLKLYFVTIFFVTGIGLQVTLCLYLNKIRRVDELNKNRKSLRIISLIITFLLFLKGIDLLLVYISDKFIFESKVEGKKAYNVFSIIRLVFYFIETGPSIVIWIVQHQIHKQHQQFSPHRDGNQTRLSNESSRMSALTISQMFLHHRQSASEDKSKQPSKRVQKEASYSHERFSDISGNDESTPKMHWNETYVSAVRR